MKQKIIILTFLLLILLGVMAMSQEMKLPEPKLYGKMSLEETLNRRRSIRSFEPDLIKLEELSQLLWAAQGITEKTWGWRTAPSAGAIYPLEVYFANKDGVFHYIPKDHKIVMITKGDKRASLTRGALGQTFINEAPVCIIITGVYERNRDKYGEGRGVRYVHIEAGHAAQNILLQAEALGLGAVPVGAFWDDVIQTSLSIPRDHEPVYLIPIGHKKE
jgi:SagB-type dehydrogenase family enzyme